MTPAPAKYERVVEAIRRGLEGEAAVDFVRQSGFAITLAGTARYLRRLGGRARVEQLIAGGKTNVEILETCLPGEDLGSLRHEPPSQQDLFGEPLPEHALPFASPAGHVYDTTKMTLTLPADVYEALRLAARAEGKAMNQVVVEVLTAALSRMPEPLPPEEEQEEGPT